MKLVIDIGNTNVKYALFNKGDLVAVNTLRHNGLVRDLEQIETFSSVSSVIISSVRGEDESLIGFLSEKNMKPLVLTHTTPLPFVNKYHTPETLGRDRIAIAAAVQKLFPQRPVLAIDAGTSITYDFVNARNEYLGGAIGPGLRMRFRALHTFTAKLPLINPDETRQPELVGKTTQESILSGVINGMLKEIEGMIEAYNQRYGEVAVILTGGDYKYFDKRLKNSIFARPNLVLEGLLEILNFNEKD